jgi:hypothetical protein
MVVKRQQETFAPVTMGHKPLNEHVCRMLNFRRHCNPDLE